MRELTIVGYLMFLAAALVLVVASHRKAAPFAPLTEVLADVFEERAARIAVIAFWWWLGWHFLVARTVDPPLG